MAGRAPWYETYWASFDVCWSCGARPGQRCRYLRFPEKSCHQAHPGRRRIRG